MPWYLKLGHQAAGQYASLPLACMKADRYVCSLRCSAWTLSMFGAEMGQHVRVGAQLEAVDRRVARDAPAPPGTRVVVNDQELAGILEERIQAADDHHVEVDEQRGAAQAVQVLLEGGQLLPRAVFLARLQMQVQRRYRQALHFVRMPLPLSVRQTKLKSPREVPAHHGIEAVDVVGAVLGAPFHAQDVPLRRPPLSRRHPQSAWRRFLIDSASSPWPA